MKIKLINSKVLLKKTNFSDQFKKIIKCYKKLDIIWISCDTAYLVINPITVYSYGFLFSCSMVGQATDSMTALEYNM